MSVSSTQVSVLIPMRSDSLIMKLPRCFSPLHPPSISTSQSLHLLSKNLIVSRGSAQSQHQTNTQTTYHIHSHPLALPSSVSGCLTVGPPATWEAFFPEPSWRWDLLRHRETHWSPLWNCWDGQIRVRAPSVFCCSRAPCGERNEKFH